MTVVLHPIRSHESVTTDAVIIDVRNPDEVAAGMLPGAVNIPLDQLPSRLDELDRDQRTVVVCRSGRRSAAAAEFLSSNGFGDVVDLAGGMIEFEASSKGSH